MVMLLPDHLRRWAMRAIVMLTFLSFAGTCYAQDPLETLNPVQDTLSTMEQTLKAQTFKAQGAQQGANKASPFHPSGDGAARQGITAQEVYFGSETPLGDDSWIRVSPCAGESTVSMLALDSKNCGLAGSGASGKGIYLWKSRAALPADLRPGVLVVAQDEVNDEGWFLAKVTDVSELSRGHIAISAPFRAQLKHVRIVEE
jgi:hypothetical protein